jgi:hypothetical protein
MAKSNPRHVRREVFVPLEEDAKGAWMSNEGPYPVAEAPLKVIIIPC